MTAARPNRQLERSERSTEVLLEAASELIVEGGFSSMTFAAIGERAGYSRGFVTARFGSKEGLVEALLRRIVGRWSRDVDPEQEAVLLVGALRGIAYQWPTDPERFEPGPAFAYLTSTIHARMGTIEGDTS